MLQSQLEHVSLLRGIHLLLDMDFEPIDVNHYCKLVGKLIFLSLLAQISLTLSALLAGTCLPLIKHT